MNKKTVIVRTLGAALLSALICLASCQSPFEQDQTVFPQGETVTELLELEFEDQAAFTKVGIATVTGTFSWTDGDQVAVWYQNGATGAWSNASITANSLTVSGTGSRAKLAVYPAGAQTNFNLTAQDDAAYPVTKIHYSNQIDLTGKDKDYAPVPMIALNDPTRNGLMFYHVGGLIRFRLHGIPANTQYIRITSNADPIAGDFPVAIPTGNEINAAELVYTKSRWCTLFDEASWNSLFGTSHGQSVLVKITNVPLAAETDNITINLPVPMGVYNELTVTAVGADGTTDLTSGGNPPYERRKKSVVWECDRATATHLSNLALKPNHPMVLPTTVHGLFRISETKQVYFASGNVLFIADKSGNNWTNRRWKFADNQWDVYADASNYQDGPNRVIDHFGWGTGNNPWLTSVNDIDYSSSSFTDWGIHFDEAGNGFDDTTIRETWHTLTNVEWNYLHKGRPKASLLWGICTIADNAGVTHDGLMYLPDEWVLPAGITFRPGVLNVYSLDGSYDGDWSVLEENGALFLPAAGYRSETVFQDGSYGRYWSSTLINSSLAYYLLFASSFGGSVSPQNSTNPNLGCSVRLYRE